MRAALVLLSLSGVVALGILISHRASCARGRREGLEDAERDLARRTPCIRRLLDTVGDITPEGIGIDEATGLPLDNTFLLCGTGVDFVAYRARTEAYNERILLAYRNGELRALTLRHKLRTADAVRTLFAEHRPVRLAKDGDRVETANGEFALEYTRTYLTLTRRDATPRSRGLTLCYPVPFEEWPGIEDTIAQGPYEVLLADEGTTAIVRDGNGFAWIVDLPRGIAVQVVGRRP